MVTACANGSIRVSDTAIQTVNGVPVGGVPAQFVLSLSPVPRIHIEFDCIELPPHFDELAATFNVSLSPTATLEVRTNLTRYERAQGRLLCKGPFIVADQSVMANEQRADLREVRFGLLNFPEFLGEIYLPPKTPCEGFVRRDFFTLRASVWVIEVRSFNNTREVMKRLRSEGGYGLTHEGTIRRADRKSFSADEVSHLLKLLRLFFSFARGEHCSLTLVAGINDEGRRVWELWNARRPSPWQGDQSWFDRNDGLTLAELFPGFYSQLWKAPDHSPLTMALQWYLLNNETRILESGIILTQVALERLSQELVGAKGSRKEGEWIACALKKAGIPREIPTGLEKLREFMDRMHFQHGPHTLVEIRNDLVHSCMKLKTLDGHVYAEACQLGDWYAELMLLYIFGYRGNAENHMSGQIMLAP